MENHRPIATVALDLDGTLLDHEGRLSPGNSAALHRAQAQGVGIILATGKTRQSAETIIRVLRLRLPGVFNQGHLIFDAQGGLLRERAMDPSLAAEVLAFVAAQRLPLVVYDRLGLWTTAHNAFSELIHTKYGEPGARILDPTREQSSINKILIGVDGNQVAMREALEAQFSPQLRVLQAVPEFIELMAPDVSKGEGLAWLLDELGLDPQAVLAVGDGENDVEMLRLAGIGVAVGNAVPAARAAADAVVAPHDQDGVAEALARFVLAPAHP